jgi:hypothetical protein
MLSGWGSRASHTADTVESRRRKLSVQQQQNRDTVPYCINQGPGLGTGQADTSPTDLDEVKPGLPVGLHDQHGEVRVRGGDALVQHAQQHCGVVRELHHEVLRLLHLLERWRAHLVHVVEEQVALAAELHLQRCMPRACELRTAGVQVSGWVPPPAD